MKTIKIGCASGFWGDSNMSTPQLLASGELDYLVFDYLAEITMSIMARQRAKNADYGYAHDFVSKVMRDALPDIAAQGVKVISNAGGVNPQSCGRAIEKLLEQLGLNLSVAVVTGDDLMERIEQLRAEGVTEMFSGLPMPTECMSMNAYLGAFPIASALDRGADIVLTGRGVDSAVTLGAGIHEFGWQPTDYDQLAGGSLAGHIIECGAQATGGLFTDWELADDWANIGYPIVEVSDDGGFVVGKPEGTGGIVCPGSVAEQMLYEIGDPQAYLLPDVVCDFSDVKITQVADQRVEVSGVKGSQPTDTLKVSATYFDGFRLVCGVTIRGIDAAGKARKTVESVLARARRMLTEQGLSDFTEVQMDFIGAESEYGPHARVRDAREVWGRLGAKHPDQDALKLLLREMTSTGTSMSPGTTGGGGGRAKPSPVVRLFSFLVDKKTIAPTVHFEGDRWELPFTVGQAFDPTSIQRHQVEQPASVGESVEVPLITIAHGRSGDKGNNANIGIIARKPEFYPIVREQLTTAVVTDYFAHLLEGVVERYDLPGIQAVNFVLHEVLGGGGIASLRADPQGKAYAQLLLDIPVRVPPSLLET
ncbi:MAG: terpene utilization protein AtuA [Planctomycetaceae bacterium]|nr:terpene utilization protein AtuA [Planctomycetaceae bacterium]